MSDDRAPASGPVRASGIRREGRLAWPFLLVFALTQPPLVFRLANRVEPAVFGWPFLFVYLLAAYVALIALLVAAARRRDRRDADGEPHPARAGRTRAPRGSA